MAQCSSCGSKKTQCLLMLISFAGGKIAAKRDVSRTYAGSRPTLFHRVEYYKVTDYQPYYGVGFALWGFASVGGLALYGQGTCAMCWGCGLLGKAISWDQFPAYDYREWEETEKEPDCLIM